MASPLTPADGHKDVDGTHAAEKEEAREAAPSSVEKDTLGIALAFFPGPFLPSALAAVANVTTEVATEYVEKLAALGQVKSCGDGEFSVVASGRDAHAPPSPPHLSAACGNSKVRPFDWTGCAPLCFRA